MDYLEAIVNMNKIISDKFIEKLIPLIDEKAKDNLTTRGGLNTEIRNVKGYPLNFETPTNIFYWNYIKTEIERLYIHYKAKFPKMQSNIVNQIELLKYEADGKYEIHTDQYYTAPRHLSVIMNLNDDYEGGDLIFTDQKEYEVKRLKLGKGSIVFFPSNFMYPHSILPVTKGTRYSIVAWLQ